MPANSLQMEPPAALSVAAAARYIGVSRAKLYCLFERKELPKTKIGSRTLVRRIDADSFLARSVEVQGGGLFD